MKYYITCGVVGLDSSLSDYRLIAPSRITRRKEGCLERETSAIRVNVDRNKLSKCRSDNYATTTENTMIKDADPEVYTLINGKWSKNKSLTDDYLKGVVEPHEFYKWLNTHGFQYACDELGYVDHYFDRTEYRERKMAKAIRYLQHTHPDYNSVLLFNIANNLAGYVHCKDDKCFEEFWVKKAIEDAERLYSFLHSSPDPDTCSKAIKEMLDKYPEE